MPAARDLLMFPVRQNIARFLMWRGQAVTPTHSSNRVGGRGLVIKP